MERQKLEGLLDRIAESDEAAQAELMGYIRQQPEGIQVLAYEALRDGGEDTYEQLILTLADDPDLVVRPSYRNQPLPDDTDWNAMPPAIRKAGEEWQARVGSKPAPPEMLEALRGGDRSARISAAHALGEFRDPASVEPLMAALRSGDRQVAAAAVQALQDIGEPAIAPLVEALQGADEQVRWNAAKALSTIGDAQAAPALVRALDDPNYGTRWLAAEALARIGRPTIVPLLRHLAKEKASSWFKQGAWHVLNKIDLRDDEARRHFKALGAEIKRSSAGTLPTLARDELRRLGEEA